jgi:hypothetical protein
MRAMVVVSVVAVIVLWGAAFAALFFFTTDFFDGIEGVDALRTQVFCARGESYVQERSRTYGGYNIYSYCVNEAGARREVSDSYWSVAIGSFLVPFFMGLAVIFVPIIAASVLPARQKERNKQKGRELAVKIAVERAASQQGETLADRMAELNEALAAGYINPSEYEAARTKLLDRFTNG